MSESGTTAPKVPRTRDGARVKSRARWGAPVGPLPLYRRPSVLGGVFLLLLAATAGVDLVSKSTPAEQASDLRTFYGQMHTDVEGCSGGLHDALYALSAIASGASHDRGTAEGIASTGAQACTPVTNSDLYDMDTTGVPNSVTKFGLQNDINNMSAWCYPDASRAFPLIETLIDARTTAVVDTTTVQLQSVLSGLRRDGTAIQSVWNVAATKVHTHLSSLGLQQAATWSPAP